MVGPGEVKLAYHMTVMAPWGKQAVDILKGAVEGKYDPFVMVLEGSIADEEGIEGYFCEVGDRKCLEWTRDLMKRAVALVAVGNCASYGGIPGDKVLEPPPGFQPRAWSAAPTGAIGLFDDPRRGYKGLINRVPEGEPYRRFLRGECKPELRPDSPCKPAVAVPGCPANGNAIMRTLAALVLAVKGLLPLPELDEYARPKFIYGPTTHEQCPRAAFYAEGNFRQYPGEGDERCLYAVGCKGPESHCPWNKVGWVNGVGGPTKQGSICIACVEPGFTDAFEPFFQKLPYVPISVEQLKNVALGVGIGSAVAGAIAAVWTHFRARKERKSEGT